MLYIAQLGNGGFYNFEASDDVEAVSEVQRRFPPSEMSCRLLRDEKTESLLQEWPQTPKTPEELRDEQLREIEARQEHEEMKFGFLDRANERAIRNNNIAHEFDEAFEGRR